MAWVNLFETEAWTFSAASFISGLDHGLDTDVAANNPDSIQFFFDPAYGLEHHYIAPSDASTGTALGYTYGDMFPPESDPFQYAVSPSGGVAGRLFRVRLLNPFLPDEISGTIIVATGQDSDFGSFSFPSEYAILWLSFQGPIDTDFVEFEGRPGAEWIVFTGSGSEGSVYPYTAYFELQVWVEDSEFWNCDCDCDWPNVTLLEMYRRVMRRMGYANQLNNPPPGVKEMVTDLIREQQQLVISDFDEIGHKRFFTWQMEIGQRFYNFDENIDVCAKLMQALTIMAVYCKRGDEIWRLNRGIDPLWFSGGIHNSDPTNYDVRQCIEVYPPPAEAMELVIFAKFKSLPLELDTDVTTADPEAIFLRTIAFYKTAKGHQDAANYMSQYQQYIGNLNADEHRDNRFIPAEDLQGSDYRLRNERLTRVMDPMVYGDEDP